MLYMRAMTIPFVKMHGCGNDFVILDRRARAFDMTPSRAAALADRHTGVGCDQLIVIEPAEPADAFMRIYNPDGSEAELSGNGSRQAMIYLRRRGRVHGDEFAIMTAAGPIAARITGAASAAVAMGHAATRSKDFPSGPADGRGELDADGRSWSFQHVSIGNPQCAIACAELESLDLPRIGPAIERHPLFPNRTNVSWYRELEPGVIGARIFERGVGETLSSGTGAVGAAIAHHLAGGPRKIVVALDGGELEVSIGAQLAVTLTGWAVPGCAGTLSEDLSKELDETQ